MEGDHHTDTGPDYADSDVDTQQLRDESAASENMFPESPVYDVEPAEGLGEGTPGHQSTKYVENTSLDQNLPFNEHAKRKLSDDIESQKSKMQKVDLVPPSAINTQALDLEVSEINITATKRKFLEEAGGSPSTSKLHRPVRCSPRKVTKRSNSCTTCCDNIRPRTPTERCDKTTTPKKTKARSQSPVTVKTHTPRPSVEFVREIRPGDSKPFSTIPEEINFDNADSQNFHLQLSPSPPDEDIVMEGKQNKGGHSSEPIVIKDRNETLTPAVINAPRSLGNTSDRSNGHSQSLLVSYQKSRLSSERATDQDSTDSVNSMVLDSPNPRSTVTSKLITKLSNGDSSTPTERAAPKHTITISDNEDGTPDSTQNVVGPKRFSLKNESFRISNSTTPSTISPLQNGHSFPLHTPGNPSFDIHIGHDEDGEFLSMYVVRTDNDLGQDMCKEFQRVSKRFTMDPYLADVSKSTSPSSVTSGGLLPLPARASFTSTSTSSTRTSDGAFVVPQPPGKAVSHQGSATVKGYKALLKKINEIFSHATDAGEEAGRSTSGDDKVSVDVQVSPGLAEHSNGSASPEEIARCDRATPKSSLKKTKVKGRRPLTGKTKRVILPTQAEEPEYMHGMNSPEMIPSGGEKDAGVLEPGDRTAGTPRSVSKVKERRRARAESPRPATPLDVPPRPEPAGYPPDTLVLAKWIDKRYYSGRVVDMLEPGKYQIKFDDGKTKALLEEFIIFGDEYELPLRGQSVYAQVDEEQTYEPGLVLAVERAGETVVYRCTTDGEATVSVAAPELYLTEDQARALKESCVRAPAPPGTPTTPSTPRRRLQRELDLDNIIHGPRSARTRDKGCSKKRLASPRSPKASTSGVKGRSATPVGRRKQRQVSESSELSEGSSSGAASGARATVEEVPGVEPEVQKTPRKIDGVQAGPLQLKGAAKQPTGKKNSKFNKFENDEDTVTLLGPIPEPGSRLFSDLHFLLTCTDQPPRNRRLREAKQYSSEEDGDCETGTDHEGLDFSERPFNKERLRAQLEAGGGVVHGHLEDVPSHQYANTRLIAPRPCNTAKYIQCLAADIRPVSHSWVIASCGRGRACDEDSFALPAGWSYQRECFVPWERGRRSSVFKERLVLLCGDPDTFVKFWERVCSLVGARTRLVSEEAPRLAGALAVLTDSDCPHEVQNQAQQEDVPLVSSAWVVQCLVEGRVCPPTGHVRYSFMYAEPD